MQTTSATFDSIVSGNYSVEYKLVLNGVTYDQSDLWSIYTQTGLFEENIPMVGCTVAGQIDVKMKKPSVTIPRMAQIKPYARVKEASWENISTSRTYVPQLGDGDAEYRCVASLGGKELISETVVVKKSESTFDIVKQPSDYCDVMGAEVTFSILAKGSNLSYQWQYSNNNGLTWANWSMTGSTTNTVTSEINSTRLGFIYRCKVTSGTSTLYTRTVRMLLAENASDFYIKQQPSNLSILTSNTQALSITVGKPNTTYQWQRRETSEWIQQGVYFIDTRAVSHNNNGLELLSLHGYDAMLKAEADYPSDSASNYPATDIYVVNKIASAMGVSVDSRTTAIMSSAYSINLPIGYSMREILGYIASMYAGNFIMSEEGKLRLVTLNSIGTETNYLIDNLASPITFGTGANETRILV